MAACGAIGGLDWPLAKCHAGLDKTGWAAAFASAIAALEFGARQVKPPVVIPGPNQFSVDEAVDRLMADDRFVVFAFEPSCDLLGRPALGQTFEHGCAELGLSG